MGIGFRFDFDSALSSELVQLGGFIQRDPILTEDMNDVCIFMTQLDFLFLAAKDSQACSWTWLLYHALDERGRKEKLAGINAREKKPKK